MQKRLFFILASLLGIVSSAAAANRFVLQESKRDRLGSLKDVVPKKVGKIEAVAANTDPAFQGMPAQTLPGSLLMPATIQNFEGMSASGISLRTHVVKREDITMFKWSTVKLQFLTKQEISFLASHQCEGRFGRDYFMGARSRKLGRQRYRHTKLRSVA